MLAYEPEPGVYYVDFDLPPMGSHPVNPQPGSEKGGLPDNSQNQNNPPQS